MQKLTGILLVLATCSVHAELYKSVDEHGNVTYTDKGGKSSAPVQPPGLTSYSPPARHTQATPPQTGTATPETKAATNYTRLVIAQPASGSALNDASGTIAGRLELVPALNAAAGHKLEIAVDGKAASQSQGLEFKLENVDRGEHQLTARVVDSSGKVLKESAPVKIQLHRPSVARKQGR